MPITTIDLTSFPGFLVLYCAQCKWQRKVFLNKGASETKEGPFNIAAESTIEVQVDGGSPQTVVFGAGSFPNFSAVTPSQLRDKLNANLTGVACRLDETPDVVVIESSSTGANSKIEIVGGTACESLGYRIDGPKDLCPGRPVLGVASGTIHNLDLIAIRRCNGCVDITKTSHELLNRTFDVAPDGSSGVSVLHRRAVNALARYLKAQGHTHPDLASNFAAETDEPTDYTDGLPGTVLVVPQG